MVTVRSSFFQPATQSQNDFSVAGPYICAECQDLFIQCFLLAVFRPNAHFSGCAAIIAGIRALYSLVVGTRLFCWHR